MIAKYNGLCKVTNQVIVAGKTEIKKINGQWQVTSGGGKTLPTGSKVTSYGNEYLPHEIEEMEQAEKERWMIDDSETNEATADETKMKELFSLFK